MPISCNFQQAPHTSSFRVARDARRTDVIADRNLVAESTSTRVEYGRSVLDVCAHSRS